ncbi:MAG: glycerol-3-phosphate dehydrogenase [Deltaproteobacteria bacterium]|nr:glycerol-3-phosphate dehydrogenase [Deltaproteobacteria bacterium]
MKHAHLFDGRRRSAVLEEVGSGMFDLVVVGGGINGAGVAHDAALRGLRPLLLEQRDLAFGTSSRSSKLIHGGLRYLEHYQFKLVFEGTNERAVLRHVAPHLVKPLLFALPVYEGARHPLWMVDVGLWMYDSLSLFKVEKRHITLRSSKRMLEHEPLLRSEAMTGGIIYYDCMTDDARLTLENALAAAELGAPILTRARVVRIEGLKGPGPVRVTFQDLLSERLYTVMAKGIVNCTGPWTDATRRAARIEGTVLRPTKGVHIVLKHERLPVHHANALVAPQDGRVFFVIPWRGRSVIGTTDTDFEGNPDELEVTADDVAYLLEAANHFFPSCDLRAQDVLAAWVGLRPLIAADDAASESDVPREHKLFVDGRMLTIAGGKLTTYRRMVAEAVNAYADLVGLRVGPTRTARTMLPGARDLGSNVDDFAAKLAEDAPLPRAVVDRLVNVYGVRARDVVAYARDDLRLRDRICPDVDAIFAEVVHAVDRELALSVEDVLVRRTSLALLAEDQGLSAVERVADLMAERLGWTTAVRDLNIAEYRQAVGLTRAFAR